MPRVRHGPQTGTAPLTHEQRRSRLDTIIARYEGRGWQLGLRLDTRAEIIGRGTRRRYLEVGADGTLTDRPLDERFTAPARTRTARRLTGAARSRTGAVVLIVLLIGAIALGLSLNRQGFDGSAPASFGDSQGDSQSESTAAGALDVVDQQTPEQWLATTQLDGDDPDDELVQSFAAGLDMLQQHCAEGRDELAQLTVDANDRLASAAIDESLLDTLQRLTHASEGQNAGASCSEALLRELPGVDERP